MTLPEVIEGTLVRTSRSHVSVMRDLCRALRQLGCARHLPGDALPTRVAALLRCVQVCKQEWVRAASRAPRAA